MQCVSAFGNWLNTEQIEYTCTGQRRGTAVSFENRTAIITGGSRGIGRAICLELAARGCNVAFSYWKSSSDAESLLAELKGSGRKAEAFKANAEDFTAAETMVQQVKERFGGVDYLVNNAGIVRDKLILRMHEKDWDDVIDTNLKGAFSFSKAVAPIMIRARTGSILNITSVSGIRGMSGQVNYSASKAGMIGMTKALARELAGRGITVNALALGVIDTEMTQGLSDEYRSSMQQNIPLGRFGSTGEVARIAAFLLSEESRYITGQVLQADGGLAM